MTTTPEIHKVGEPLSQDEAIASLSRYGYGWVDSDEAGASAQRGLSEAVVRDISGKKNEPEWMLESRLRALRTFDKKPMPNWGSNLEGIDFDNIKYFVRSTEKQAATWDDLPADIRNTYDRLGIPEAEKQRLVSGVAAQYESEVVYHQIREDLEALGVIFLDTDTALKEHEDIFKQYFGTVIPAGDNKFSALNTAVWSGGSFIYVPPGVHVDIPLQAYFRINTENMGQFERTLIIVDEGAYVHYVEGCTAPIYKSDSLHSAVVEIIVKPGGRCRYTTIQNWSNNVYNLVTKRARAEAGATMEWVDGNIGSKVTMKYPAVWMTGEHAKGEVLSVAFAGEGQHQDTGAKMLHLAPNTSSNIVSKSVARGGGRASYRGLVQVNKGAHGSRSSVKCDALLVDTISRSRHLPVRRHPRGRRDDGPRGHRVEGQRGSAVLPDEPRHDRGRGDGDGRARLRRADRQGTADGVRAGAQPADRASDGRRGRLVAQDLTATLEGRTKGEIFTSFDVDAFEVPHGRDEIWRFTPLRRLRGLHDGSAPATGSARIDVTERPGVTVETVRRGDERLGQGGAPADRVAAQAFSSFNSATIVTVGKDTQVGEPIEIAITGPGEGATAYGHLQMRVGELAEAVVVIDQRGSGTYADNIEFVVGDAARLTVVSIADWADDAVHVSSHHATLGKDAVLRHVAVTLGGDLVRLTARARFCAPGGDVELLGLYFADDGQHFESRLLVDHAQPNCRSHVTYKGALQGDPDSDRPDAHTVWVGDVLIRAAATGTDTFETNRNLVLTDGARADSVPNLEIETGEIVGAGHASATGRFDDEQLFYLRARGIPEDQARRLVVRGFFGELIQKIAVPAVRERLTDAIEHELETNRIENHTS